MIVSSKINSKNLSSLQQKMVKNLIKSVDALKTDVIKSQIMPFDTGNMQDKSMFVDEQKTKKYVLLRVDTPYARKIYFHPEYNFKKDKNSNAQGHWFTPWITGNKKLFLRITFARFMRKDLR